MRCKMKAMNMDMCIYPTKHNVCFYVRTCRRRRRGQTEGFARRVTIYSKLMDMYITVYIVTMPLYIYICL